MGEYVVSGALFVIFKMFNNLFENQKLDTIAQSLVYELDSSSPEELENVLKMLALFQARKMLQQVDLLPLDWAEEIGESSSTKQKEKMLQSFMSKTFKFDMPNEDTYSLDY